MPFLRRVLRFLEGPWFLAIFIMVSLAELVSTWNKPWNADHIVRCIVWPLTAMLLYFNMKQRKAAGKQS